MRQSFGLARARAGDHEEGPWIIADANAVLYSVALLAIELAQIGGSLWHVESSSPAVSIVRVLFLVKPRGLS